MLIDDVHGTNRKRTKNEIGTQGGLGASESPSIFQTRQAENTTSQFKADTTLQPSTVHLAVISFLMYVSSYELILQPYVGLFLKLKCELWKLKNKGGPNRHGDHLSQG